MGFNCLVCGEREIWAFESDTPRICRDCYDRQHGIVRVRDPNAQIMMNVGSNVLVPNYNVGPNPWIPNVDLTNANNK